MFPFIRAAAVHPRRTMLPYCYDDPDTGRIGLVGSVLAQFATVEAFGIVRFVRQAGL